jgi:pre-mRNA-splicing factor CDC5/CEF1
VRACVRARICVRQPPHRFESDDISATRAPLVLPEAQISEQDLDTLTKSAGATSVGGSGSDSQSIAGDSLAPETPRSVLALPTRTPRVEAADNVRAHARAAVQAKELQTPLLGEDTSTIEALPRAESILPPSQTPRSTRSAAGGAGEATPKSLAGWATPASGVGGAARAGSTPYRDGLGINTPRSVVGSTPRDFRAYKQQQKVALRDALSSLPQPRAASPIAPASDESTRPLESSGSFARDGESAIAPDQADADAELALKAQSEHSLWEAAYLSTVLRRGDLPRPVGSPSAEQLVAESVYEPGTPLHRAEALIASEMVKVIRRDLSEVPVPGAVPISQDVDALPSDVPDKSGPALAEFASQLEAAKQRIQQEAESLYGDMSQESLWSAWRSLDDGVSLAYDVEAGYAYPMEAVDEATLKPQDAGASAVPSWPTLFASMSGAVTAAAKKAARLEKRVGVLTAGYAMRSQQLAAIVRRSATDTQELAFQLHALSAMRAEELRAAPLRLEQIQHELAAAKREERDLQERYAVVAGLLGGEHVDANGE